MSAKSSKPHVQLGTHVRESSQQLCPNLLLASKSAALVSGLSNNRPERMLNVATKAFELPHAG